MSHLHLTGVEKSIASEEQTRTPHPEPHCSGSLCYEELHDANFVVAFTQRIIQFLACGPGKQEVLLLFYHCGPNTLTGAPLRPSAPYSTVTATAIPSLRHRSQPREAKPAAPPNS